ncbi:MAG: glycosyltransferase [Clostridiales bacterium]|nr:glycosyltransferase [Clostridiales bacterium]
MPKVSVLMGVYNCSETLGRSIESIINQTFTDWEMIICDDGSSDNSAEIVVSYQAKDPRIVLLRNGENRGLAFTLNRCIELSCGEYCARMDGDDVCAPDRFKKQVDFLDAHTEYGFVSTTMKRFDEYGVYQDPEVQGLYEPVMKDYIKGSPFCHAPAMIRKKAYEAVGGYRDIEMTRQMEDYDMWFRMYAADIKGCIIREPLYSMFDGRSAAHRRTFKRRLNEAKVRREGYKAINAPAYAYLYIMKPVVLGLIPQWLYRLIR